MASCGRVFNCTFVTTPNGLLKITYLFTNQYLFLEIDELGSNNDDLPDGWKRIIHDSGMPLYIHEELKTCTFTKPYFLGVHSLKVINFLNV